MKKSTKAALLSAFVFPGVGLWWLKRFTRACIFMVPAIIALTYITICLYAIAQALQLNMASGVIDIDPFNMERTMTQVQNFADDFIAKQHYHLDFARNILFASWILGIVSSYFVGKQIEMAHKKPTP